MGHSLLNIEFNDKHIVAKHYKYALAVNIMSNGVNAYKGFKTFFEIKQFLTNVKNSSIKRKCLFELIKTECDVKPFFDIDKSKFTHDEFNQFLNDFIVYFNIFFRTQITLNELLVYIRDDTINTEIIKSGHLIISNHKINIKLIPTFIEYFETITERRYITENNTCVIDKAIYTSNRIFNLPYNTKLKYIEQDITNPKYFKPYKEQKDDVSDYFISYTDNIEKSLKNNGGFKLFNILGKINKTQLSYAFNKLKNNNKPKNTIVDPIEMKIEEIELTNLNCICETIEHLINYLPKEFYFNNADWVLTTKILKKHGLSDANVKRWLNHSSLITNNNWDYKLNSKWYNSVDITNIWFGIPKFLNILNPYLSNKPINFYNDIELVKYIQNKTNNSFNEADLIDTLDKNKFVIEYDINKNNFELNEKYMYNFKTGFLYSDALIIGNYYYDIGLKKLYQSVKLEDTIIIEDINIMKQISIDFVNNDETVLACKAKWGSGKTYIIVKNVFEEAVRQNKRCIFITENNALNKKYTEEFNIQSHLTTKNINDELSVACSTESLNKIHINETDIIVLDEFETILSHYESETFKDKAFSKFLILKDALIKVNKIIVLDADLSKDRLKLLTGIKDGTKIKPYDIKTNNFKEYKFNMFVKEKPFINTIIKEALKQNNKIVIPSSSKEFNKNIVNEIHNRDKTKTILKIDSDGILLIKHGDHNKVDIKNLEEFILYENVDVFCYSPSIKTGISINQEYFNKCYGYAHNKSCNIREFIQMLFRARQLKDKEINVFLNGGFSRIKTFIDIKHISKILLNPIMLYYTSKIFNGSFEITDKDNLNAINIDPFYLELKMINETENYNSASRFNQDFVMRLKYAHDINLNYIDTNLIIDEIELTDCIIDEKLNNFINCELVSFNKFNNLTEDDWLMRQKYNFFHRTFYIEGITNQVYPDQDIYNSINNETFYKTYLDKCVYKSYTSIKHNIKDENNNSLNKTLTDIQTENETNIEKHKTEFIDLGNKPKKVVKSILLIQLLEQLEIDLLKIPFTITNKDLNAKIDKFKFNGFLKILKQFYESNEVETNFNFNPNDKKYVNNMKEIIKSLLTHYDIEFKYVNHNTTREFDKIIFNYVNFINKSTKYEGRLKSFCHFKLIVDQVEKTRNTYKYKNEITDTYYKCYKTENANYFNTYEVRISNDLKKIKEQVIKYTEKTNLMYRSGNIELLIKELHDKAVLIELYKYLNNKNKPKIISENKYQEIYNKYICDAIEANKNNNYNTNLDDKYIKINLIWVKELNNITKKFSFDWSIEFNQKVNKMVLTTKDYSNDFDEVFLQEDIRIKKRISHLNQIKSKYTFKWSVDFTKKIKDLIPLNVEGYDDIKEIFYQEALKF